MLGGSAARRGYPTPQIRTYCLSGSRSGVWSCSQLRGKYSTPTTSRPKLDPWQTLATGPTLRTYRTGARTSAPITQYTLCDLSCSSLDMVSPPRRPLGCTALAVRVEESAVTATPAGPP